MDTTTSSFTIVFNHLWVLYNVKQCDVAFANEEKHANRARAFLDMGVAASAHFFREAANCLRTKDFATEEAQGGVGDLLARRRALPVMRLFHQNVKVLGQSDQLQWRRVQEPHTQGRHA